MRVNNAITPKNTLRQTVANQPKQSDFSTAVLSNALQNQITKSVPDEKSRARFTAAIIEMVSNNTQLQKCSPASIVSAALRGEGQGLILGHGYYVVPYGEKASYITSYRGYISLAMSTGLYSDLDCLEVREGEFKGRDRRTGKQTIDFSVYETDEERMQHPIVGYYAYFELKDGFFRSEYWDIDKLMLHAARYSQAFDISLFKKAAAGTMTPEEKKKYDNGSPWYTSTDRMCKKTVLRSLLNSGFAPLSNEVRNFIANDVDERIVPADQRVTPVNDPLIIDAAPVPVAKEPEKKAEEPEQTKQTKKPESQESIVSNRQAASKPKGKEIPVDPLKVGSTAYTSVTDEHMNPPTAADEQFAGQASIFDSFEG